MELRYNKKILNFMKDVAEDTDMDNNQVLLTTRVIGVPDIYVSDVKIALSELSAVEEKLKAVEKLYEILMERAKNMNNSENMFMNVKTLPKTPAQLPQPTIAAIPLGYCGSMGMIKLSK